MLHNLRHSTTSPVAHAPAQWHGLLLLLVHGDSARLLQLLGGIHPRCGWPQQPQQVDSESSSGAGRWNTDRHPTGRETLEARCSDSPWKRCLKFRPPSGAAAAQHLTCSFWNSISLLVELLLKKTGPKTACNSRNL